MNIRSLAAVLAASVALPLAVILMLWWLARATWQRAEQWQPEAAPPDAPPSPAITATPFDDPEIWNGRERAEFLRHVHIAAAVANVAVLLAYAYVRITDSGEVLLTLASQTVRLGGIVTEAGAFAIDWLNAHAPDLAHKG